MAKYFYDTYAIIEYLKGNQNYRRYFRDSIGVTTKLNLMELYYGFIDDKKFAGKIFDSFSTIAVEISDEQYKSAMDVRKELKDRGLNISYVDAVGYSIAMDLKLKFLTGDREFRRLSGVEFVK